MKQQTDDEIHEDQLLNFLVNTLTGAFSLTLGENAEIDPDDIFKVLVGAEWSAQSMDTHSAYLLHEWTPPIRRD